MFMLLVVPVLAASELSDELRGYLTSGIGLAAIFLGVIQLVLLTLRGQSLGKLAMGIRIVAQDGSPAGFISVVLLRLVVPQIIQAFCGIFGLIDSLYIFSQDSRCIHDHIASTIVIQAEQQSPRSF